VVRVPRSMPIVVANELVKAYGTRTLLKGVDVSIHDGERVGLVGDNGSGKSTLARILAGLDTPDTGTVAVNRTADIVYLEQEPTLPPDATAREAIEVGLGAWRHATERHAAISTALSEDAPNLDQLVAEQAEVEATIERLGGWDRGHEVSMIMEALGIMKLTSPCSAMSGGERRRVALAQVLIAKPTLAILDEPTNHLDADAIDWLERYLSERFPGSVLLLTHDRWLLDRLVDRTIELDRGHVYVYEGGWDSYLIGKAARTAFEERAEANRQNFLSTELEWLRRSPAARSTKQRARVERAEAAVATRAPDARRAAELTIETTRLGKTILDARGLGIEAYGRTLVRSLDFALCQGERIGIVGPNGAGKSTLIRTLMGEFAHTSGEVVRGSNTTFAYLDQARSGLVEDATLEENVAGTARRIDFGGSSIDVRSYLQRFLFSSEDGRKKVSTLSGGERARVALAKLLISPANVLVLDEPTNDLDVTMLSSLEGLIVENELTALVVSHDRYFLDRITTGILELDGNGAATLYQGNWDIYVRLRNAARAEAAARAKQEALKKPAATKPSQAPSAPNAPSAPSSKKGLSYKERIELEGIVGRIEAMENEVAALETTLADPATYASGADPRELVATRDALRVSLDAAVERWSDLEARKID
jgi:ATP-binding cassette subfamily F protein uup